MTVENIKRHINEMEGVDSRMVSDEKHGVQAEYDEVFETIGSEEHNAVRNEVESNRYTDEYLEELWDELRCIPFDELPDGRVVLAIPWHIFLTGTLQSEILCWFDKQHSKGVKEIDWEGIS